MIEPKRRVGHRLKIIAFMGAVPNYWDAITCLFHNFSASN